MKKKNVLLFIGACGIAVRAIAPHIVDKLYDSPVLVIDEQGRYVIPLLSGHMGGANEIAAALAEKLQAEPVITTATDINGKFAVDLFAKRNGLFIGNKDGIAKVSSKVLDEKVITVSIEPGHVSGKKIPEYIRIVSYPPDGPVDIVITSERREFETDIYLYPKEYVIGMGCKKGKDCDSIADFIKISLVQLNISYTQIFALTSIEQKAHEPGLVSWAQKEKIPFLTYSAEQLEAVKGEFHDSAFVEKTVGVANVCERAALSACKDGGALILEKQVRDGMTLAVAKRKWSVNFNEI